MTRKKNKEFFAYHPVDVLELDTTDTGKAHHSTETSIPIHIPTETFPPGQGPTRHDDVGLLFQPTSGTTGSGTTTRTAETLTIAESSSINQGLGGRLANTTQNAQSIVLAQDPGQSNLILNQAAMMQSMNQRFDRLQVEMDKNKEFRGQLAHIHQLQQETNEELLKRQQEMLQMQQKALDRLAIIQSSVQALVTQTYELHEYPIPRLFIVLPKTLGLSDKLKSLFSDQFRLYFLCECGSHTMPEDSKIQHQIHLAKHEGYDLDKPSAFFERYGSYVLTVMHMIKYGIAAAGVVVPSLASTKIVDGLDTAEQHLDYIKKNLAPLVDDTINFLNGVKNDKTEETDMSLGHSGFDQLEALEGADLRQLESYLKVKDQGRVLGNLYRIVTSEGHVKWVCFDHYRANYRETAIKRLKSVVAANEGTYVEETGRIEITATSKTVAREFYEAIIKARWIQELDVTLGWDATMDDLRELAKAVTNANVVSLTVEGSYLKGPALDVVNRTRRFDPIMQMASNSRLQCLRIKGFEDFFSRVSKSSMVAAPKLRALSLQSELPFQDKAKSLDNILELYPALTALEVRINYQDSIARAMSDTLEKLPQIESLRIDQGFISITVNTSKGEIQNATPDIDRYGDLNSDNLKVISKPQLTRMMKIPSLLEEYEDQFYDILRKCPTLHHVRIGCKSNRSLAILDSVILTRNDIIQKRGSCGLRTFELMDEHLVPFDTLAERGFDTQIQSHLSFHEGSKSFDMRTWIRLKESFLKDLEIEKTFFALYGWSIVYFDGFIRDVPSSRANVFMHLWSQIPNAKALQLENLKISAKDLLDDEVDHLAEIRRRSPNFKTLFLMAYIGAEPQLDKAEAIFSQHGAILSGFCFSGGSQRFSNFISSFPTRSSLPSLESIEFSSARLYYSSDIVSWIITMVSGPPQEPPPSAASQSLLQTAVGVQTNSSAAEPTRPWKPLRKIMIRNGILEPDAWKGIIEAIDLSALDHLDISGSNIPQEQFRLLVGRISEDGAFNLPLRILNVVGTEVTKTTDSKTLDTMVTDLRRNIPTLQVLGTW
ncbi:hypothetical protein BGX34_001355 [Mortierella sp. NVP85]|nr:hypothetical protein BGX34_001355 [Mortierella sp. NVP85]